MDTLSSQERSAQMALVKSKDTKPEVFVRKLIYQMGYRYRLHAEELPGSPDIVFRPWHKAIFVHGCFWHGHKCKRGQRMPEANKAYWIQKLTRNKKRDAQNQSRLKKMGWKFLIIWECALKDPHKISTQISYFLDERMEEHKNVVAL